MLTTWAVNAVALCHVQRFFLSAHTVAQTMDEVKDDMLGEALTLLGNMQWARSSFEGRSPAEERAMAYTGAVLGSVGDRILPPSRGRAQAALSFVAWWEQELYQNWSGLIQTLWDGLPEADRAGMSPAALNAHVWSRLFPGYPWGEGVGALQQRMRQRWQ